MITFQSLDLESEFVEVNLPFSWGDIEYTDEEYADPNFVEKPCFRDEVGLKPGMLLDCLSYGERKFLFIGNINTSTGYCGCCNESIRFVYRYLQYPLPPFPSQGENTDESRTE